MIHAIETFVIPCIGDWEWHSEMTITQFLLLTGINGLFLFTHCSSFDFVSASSL